MQQSIALELFGTLLALLPTLVVALVGWLLLRRLEEIKSEVARYSDFNRKWADVFFDDCQRFMISVERVLALLSMLTVRANRNDDTGMKWQHEVNDLLVVVTEYRFRLKEIGSPCAIERPNGCFNRGADFE